MGSLPTQVQFSINNPAATAMSVPTAEGSSAAAESAVPAVNSLPATPAVVQSSTSTPIQIPLPSNTPAPGVTITAMPISTQSPGPVQTSPGACECTDMPSSTVTNDCELQVRCPPSQKSPSQKSPLQATLPILRANTSCIWM